MAFGSYGTILRAPGAAAFCSASFVMRWPLSMYPVSLVLLVSLRDGDYAFGSLLTAAYIAGVAVGGPVLSRVSDRRGQRAVLVPWTIVHAVAVSGLLAAVLTDRPRWVWLVLAVVIGFSYLSVGSLVRARWAQLFAGTPQLGTAFSLEATLDELIYVTGPILASVLATQLDPLAPFVVMAVLVVAGAIALCLLPGGDPSVRPGDADTRAPLPRAPIVLLVGTLVAVGATLGAVDLATLAYVGQAGYASWSGAVLACFALGSGVAGLVYGIVRWRAPVERRLRDQAVVFAVLPALLLAVTGVGVLAPVLFVVGLATAPMLIVSFGVAERVTPPERLTEAMAWIATGVNVGAGAIAPVIGLVADSRGAGVALRLPWPAAVAAAVLALFTVVSVGRHLRERARRGPGVGAPWDDDSRAALP